MNVFELTRALIDIESITDNEEQVGRYLYDYLAPLAARYDGRVERMEVEPRRFNVFAQLGRAASIVTLSTHMDTVPPFFPSREDDEFIWGRGACDTKGIIASMINAAEALLEAGERNFGLLFVVGEERNSAGAYHAAQTSARLALHHQRRAHRKQAGARLQGRAALRSRRHAARWRTPPIRSWANRRSRSCSTRSPTSARIELPVDPLLGPSTLNIGTISGGRAPNVIPDEARAEIMIRLVGDSAATKAALRTRRRRPRRTARGRSKFPRCVSAPSTASRPPWSPTPPISRRSAAPGASRF